MQAFDLTLAARPESLPIVRHVLGALPRSWPVDASVVDDVRIAVTEACANVVMHAYPDSDDGLLEVRGELDGRRLMVRVRDHGCGMRPRMDSPGLGVGLPLIIALTDEFEIAQETAGTNDLHMTFVGGPDDRG